MEIFYILIPVFLLLVFNRQLGAFIERLIEKHLFKKFLQQEEQYKTVIGRYMKFYHRLNEEQKRKFLFRTFLFHRSKKFHYIDLEEVAEMPLLISAVAVQLSFGLEKYKLNYFKNIFVLRDDYHYGFYSRPFQGHVDHSGIYLSWDNFMRGIQGRSPNCNVGLHEMGHALAYVNFITQTEEDKHFKKEFHNFSRIARPIFNSMQEGKKNVLGDYAGTNYHEFWAVSVEFFFENPVMLRHDLPELYTAMVKLLRQDPLARIKANNTYRTRVISMGEKAAV